MGVAADVNSVPDQDVSDRRFAAQVALGRFGPLPTNAETALAADARDVRRYLASEPEPAADEEPR
jgi:hypothetical protein